MSRFQSGLTHVTIDVAAFDPTVSFRQLAVHEFSSACLALVQNVFLELRFCA